MNVYRVIFSALVGCVVSGSSLLGVAAAQTAGATSEFIWENDSMVVRRVPAHRSAVTNGACARQRRNAR